MTLVVYDCVYQNGCLPYQLVVFIGCQISESVVQGHILIVEQGWFEYQNELSVARFVRLMKNLRVEQSEWLLDGKYGLVLLKEHQQELDFVDEG